MVLVIPARLVVIAGNGHLIGSCPAGSASRGNPANSRPRGPLDRSCRGLRVAAQLGRRGWLWCCHIGCEWVSAASHPLPGALCRPAILYCHQGVGCAGWHMLPLVRPGRSPRRHPGRPRGARESARQRVAFPGIRGRSWPHVRGNVAGVLRGSSRATGHHQPGGETQHVALFLGTRGSIPGISATPACRLGWGVRICTRSGIAPLVRGRRGVAVAGGCDAKAAQALPVCARAACFAAITART